MPFQWGGEKHFITAAVYKSRLSMWSPWIPQCGKAIHGEDEIPGSLLFSSETTQLGVWDMWEGQKTLT
jgi:hypothetical protein